jgi:uncharacterized protein (TIGR00251 family)
VACYRVEADAIVVSVRLTPKADRDAVDGVKALADGREVVAVRVRAVPDRGAANKALVQMMAKAFRRPKSAVAVVAGGKQRLKQVKIAGDPDQLLRIVEGWQLPRR